MASTTSEGFVVPRSYTELQRQYGPYIQRLLGRFNKVERNFEDLHSHIWVKILEARVLERFDEYVEKQVPKVLSAIEACDLLGISWQQWRAAMSTYHKGIPTQIDEDGEVVQRRRGRWMPTPINAAEFQARGIDGHTSKYALFSFIDVLQLTLEERIDGVLRKPFRVTGRMIDSEGNVIAQERPEGDIKIPEVRVTPSQFKNYLTMAVLNHYANFCRTMKRRHKERPHTPHAQQEDATAWESTLPDQTQSPQDTMVELEQARGILKLTLEECLDGVQDCRPAEEHEVEIFTKLKEGQSLMQALRSADLPNRVRKSVLDVLRWTASEER